MFFGKSDDTRITVLEQQFPQFQQQMVDHMRNEEVAFEKMTIAIKDIGVHIDLAQEKNMAMMESTKENILKSVEHEYISKIEHGKELTNLRTSILEDLEKTHKTKVKEYTILILGLLAVVSVLTGNTELTAKLLGAFGL